MRVIIIGLGLLSIMAASGQETKENERSRPLVYHLVIDDVIDPRTNRKTELALAEAEELKADYVILELDTYGGALNDADDIRTRILNFEIPIYAFINKDAASAGALISIACDSIYMAPGSSIGAATVVTGEGEQAPDKYQSYMRSIMRSTAEATGRNPKIAEGMVDEDIDLDSIAQEGKVITFSVTEAKKYGFCDAEVNSIDEIMSISQVEAYDLKKYEQGATESIIAFFLNPAISGVLILVIIGGIYFELQTPGVGFPLAAAILALVFYLVPFYLNGLAANWEIALFLVGLALIAVEVFVIPGFGVAGILGISGVLSSLVLVMLNNDDLDFSFVEADRIWLSILVVIAAMGGGVILLFVGGASFTNTKAFKRISLSEEQGKDAGYTSSFYSGQSMVGKEGVAHTILRPSGKIMVDNEMYDAYTRGEYIDKGNRVVVISDEGTSLRVKLKDE